MFKYLLVIVAFLVIVIVALYMALRPGNDFHGLLEYEVQNRAFARLSLQDAVNQTQDPGQKKFLEAYLELEKLNQRKYAPMLDKYGVGADASAFTRFRIWGGSLLMPLAPEASLKMMCDAAIRYVPKLERLRSLATEDAEFFKYVVAQEQVQADGLTLVAAQKYSEGATLLDDFVRQHSK